MGADQKHVKRTPWRFEAGTYLRLLFSPGYNILDVFLLLAGVICAIGAGIPFPLLAILFGQLIDDANSASCESASASTHSSLSNSVEQKVLYVIYVTIASWCFIYIHVSCWTMFGERLVRRLREKYLRCLLRQELAFFDDCPAGHVSSTLSTDLEQIQTGTSEKVGICIASISYFVAAYVVAFTKVPKLAGILVSLVPAYLLMSLGGSFFIKRSTVRVSDQLSSVTSIVSESLNKIGVVHAFGAETRIGQQLAKHLAKARKESINKSIAAAVQLGLLYFIAYSTNALAYWQGSRVIAAAADSGDSHANVGAVYTVIFLLIDASYLISQVAPFMQIFGTATGASDRLKEVLERQSLIDGTDKEHGCVIKPIEGGIELQDVRFTYKSRPDHEVLKGISLNIPAYKHTAIVGHSGSGKSTIAALIARLYDQDSGTIALDGVDIRDINVHCLRGCIGIVSQDALLLDRPILENIAHGLINSSVISPDEEKAISDGSLAKFCERVTTIDSWDSLLSSQHPAIKSIVDRCTKAAKIANAHDFISKLENGFNTHVGPAGSQLSGGQKQRIALARAVVREPRILLLDEATSALDSRTEQTIRSALQQASRGRTTISIVHRLSTVKEADNIIVLRSGQIVEQGRHLDLLAADGVYASMVRLQNVSQDESTGAAVEGVDFTRSEHESTSVRDSDLDSRTRPPVLSGVSRTKSDDDEHGKDAQSDPTESVQKHRGVLSTIKGILSLCRSQALYGLIALIASIIVGGSFSGEAVIFGHTVSSLSTCNGANSVRKAGHLWGLLYFILAIIEFCANFSMSLFFGLVSENTLYKIKLLLFESLMSRDMEWHESEGRTPASLLSHLTTDASALSGLTGVILGTFFSIIVSTIAGIVLAHAVAWRIAVVLLGCIPVLLGAGVMKLRTLAIFHEKHAAAFSKATGYAVEAVNSIRTIVMYSLEDEVLSVYHRALQRPYEDTLRTILWSNIWFASAYSASSLVYALAYWWGSKNVIEGYYNQTQFFIVLPALLFSAQKCGQLFALAPDFSKSRVSAAKILDLLADGGTSSSRSGQPTYSAGDYDEKEKDIEACPIGPGSGSLVRSGGAHVAFEDVWFSYPTRPGIDVLQGLNIEIRPGQFCALVGPSGAGKSTTIALLERFYRPAAGHVTIDGHDITKYYGTGFRDSIALVPQDNVIFEGTIRFNLALGARPGHDVSDAEIADACRLANIHDTITAMPDGYDTYTGPNGNQLSEGQKQRLSIARALLRKPRLLLLDESTSALDAENEKLFQDTLNNIRHGITIVAVAHRLHTIEKADCIFVIEGGKCSARGTHGELLQNSETYRTNALHQVLDA